MRGMCGVCGSIFEMSPVQQGIANSGRIVYCSHGCLSKARIAMTAKWSEEHRPVVPDTIRRATCASSRCHAIFTPSRAQMSALTSGKPIYCSPECAAKAHVEKALFTGEDMVFESCIICGAKGYLDATMNKPGGGVSSEGLCRLCEKEIELGLISETWFRHKLSKIMLVYAV